jgi:RimJ/RimL family protein N-acetyltransferase
MNFKEIETARLLVRPICVEDSEAFAQLLTSPGAQPVSVEHARKSIAMTEEALRHRECILIVLFDKTSSRLVGFFAVSRSKDTDIGDLHYHLAEEFRGLGYMSEAGPVALKIAEDLLAISDFEAVVTADHAASIGVLKRMGFVLAGEWLPPVPIAGQGRTGLRYVRRVGAA